MKLDMDELDDEDHPASRLSGHSLLSTHSRMLDDLLLLRPLDEVVLL
jgi:hypothetical protein